MVAGPLSILSDSLTVLEPWGNFLLFYFSAFCHRGLSLSFFYLMLGLSPFIFPPFSRNYQDLPEPKDDCPEGSSSHQENGLSWVEGKGPTSGPPGANSYPRSLSLTPAPSWRLIASVSPWEFCSFIFIIKKSGFINESILIKLRQRQVTLSHWHLL